jgi:hypothetical protein
MSDHRPPLRARLHQYLLTSDEFALLSSMCEHRSDGSTIWAAIPRLSAYSKLSDRTAQRIVRELRQRGILSEIAPPNAAKRRPTTYRINEAAFEDDPRMAPYRICQRQLPGIARPAIPGEPIPDRPLVTAGRQTGDRKSADLVTAGHQSGDCLTPNSKAFDPKALDTKPMIPHFAISSENQEECHWCHDTGLRASLSKPRTVVECDCQAGAARTSEATKRSSGEPYGVW